MVVATGAAEAVAAAAAGVVVALAIFALASAEAKAAEEAVEEVPFVLGGESSASALWICWMRAVTSETLTAALPLGCAGRLG